MPEIPSARIREMGIEVIEFYINPPAGRWLDNSKAIELAEKYGFEFIGGGAECIVVKEPSNLSSRSISMREKIKKWFFGNKDEEYIKPELVVAVGYGFYKEPKVAKKEFYLHRLISTLFPHNFPKFVSSFGTTDKKAPHVTFREFVSSKDSRIRRGTSYRTLDKKSVHPIQKAFDFFKEFDLSIEFDISGFNYCLGQDGGTYYMDTVVSNMGKNAIPTQTIERVIEWMKDKKYSERDIVIVKKSFERINELIKD